MSGENKVYQLIVNTTEKGLSVKEAHSAEDAIEFICTTDIPINKVQLEKLNQNSLPQSIEIDQSKSIDYLDTINELAPEWRIQLSAFKKQHKLTFAPLDINGVRFDIFLPTADSRLNEIEPEFPQVPDV